MAKRIRLRAVVAPAFIGLLSILLAACSSPTPAPSGSGGETTDGKEVTIGALYLDAQGFYGGIKKGIEDGAKEEGQGINLLGQNSGGDVAQESEFLSTLISGKVDAIITSPVSAEASVAGIKQAFDAGIPVICYNSCINKADAEKYIYALVTTDQDKLGYDVGIIAGNYFKDKGISAPRFGILNCDVYEACLERKAGFKRGVEEILPGVVWAADQAGFEPDKSTATATTMLTGDDKIEAMYGTTDNGTIGAIQGVVATQRSGKTVVFGNDISVQLANYFKTNPEILLATNGQLPQIMGRESVKVALKAIAGEKNDTYLVTVPTQMFKVEDTAGLDAWLTEHADGIP
ncbi:MAG: substrate-binding domain-containing protein [Propionibacteriaceae bacterium]|jgi:simple sugar transport system substrate-binding protein|nr:substrate-binding domain-containing protein [Propionibacteriaceae bacterium]